MCFRLSRLNTLRELRRHFPTTHFEHFSYLFNGEPSYHVNSLLLARAIEMLARLTPDYLPKSLHVFRSCPYTTTRDVTRVHSKALAAPVNLPHLSCIHCTRRV
jgi:hypothetical protein